MNWDYSQFFCFLWTWMLRVILVFSLQTFFCSTRPVVLPHSYNFAQMKNTIGKKLWWRLEWKQKSNKNCDVFEIITGSEVQEVCGDKQLGADATKRTSSIFMATREGELTVQRNNSWTRNTHTPSACNICKGKRCTLPDDKDLESGL